MYIRHRVLYKVSKIYIIQKLIHLICTFRKRQRSAPKRVHEYEKVKDPKKVKNIKPTITVLHNHPESESNPVTTKPFIVDVHNRSENEKDTEAKVSVKNTLYERGRVF